MYILPNQRINCFPLTFRNDFCKINGEKDARFLPSFSHCRKGSILALPVGDQAKSTGFVGHQKVPITSRPARTRQLLAMSRTRTARASSRQKYFCPRVVKNPYLSPLPLHTPQNTPKATFHNIPTVTEATPLSCVSFRRSKATFIIISNYYHFKT